MNINENDIDNEESNATIQNSEIEIDESTIIEINKDNQKRKKQKKRFILKNNRKNRIFTICYIFLIVFILLILAYCIILFIYSLKLDDTYKVEENINDIDVVRKEENLIRKDNISNINNNITNNINITSITYKIEETINKFIFNSTNKL